jgi:hypothetical protein
MAQKQKIKGKPVEESLGFSFAFLANLLAFTRGLFLATSVLVAGVMVYFVGTTPGFFQQPPLCLIFLMSIGVISYLLYGARQVMRLQVRLRELRHTSPNKPPERWWTRRD